MHTRGLNDEQWKTLDPLIPKPRRRRDGRGRPGRSRRSVLNGVLWVLRTGAPGLASPTDTRGSRPVVGDFSNGLTRFNSVQAPSASHNCAGVARNCLSTKLARTAGLVSPSASAFSIRRALTPNRSETTLDNLMWASPAGSGAAHDCASNGTFRASPCARGPRLDSACARCTAPTSALHLPAPCRSASSTVPGLPKRASRLRRRCHYYFLDLFLDQPFGQQSESYVARSVNEPRTSGESATTCCWAQSGITILNALTMKTTTFIYTSG
jgi:transposase